MTSLSFMGGGLSTKFVSSRLMLGRVGLFHI